MNNRYSLEDTALGTLRTAALITLHVANRTSYTSYTAYSTRLYILHRIHTSAGPMLPVPVPGMTSRVIRPSSPAPESLPLEPCPERLKARLHRAINMEYFVPTHLISNTRDLHLRNYVQKLNTRYDMEYSILKQLKIFNRNSLQSQSRNFKPGSTEVPIHVTFLPIPSFVRFSLSFIMRPSFVKTRRYLHLAKKKKGKKKSFRLSKVQSPKSEAPSYNLHLYLHTRSTRIFECPIEN